MYVKLRPHRQNFTTQRIYSKLAVKYFRPFQIMSQIGEVAYKLHLPLTSRIHLVFHVSQLKRAIGEVSAEAVLPLELKPEFTTMIEPEAVILSREVTKMGERIEEWLVHWKNKPIEEATWGSAIDIQNQFLTFCLEDKAVSARGHIDRNQS